MSIPNIANPEIRIQVQVNPPAAARRGMRGRGVTRGRRGTVTNNLVRQPLAANSEPAVYRVPGAHHTADVNAGIRAVFTVPGMYRVGQVQGNRGGTVHMILNQAPQLPLQVHGLSHQQRGGATAAALPPSRMLLPVSTRATMQAPDRIPVPAAMPPPNRQPSPPVNPIEISSESSEGSEEGDVDVGYFPGYGHCIRCGSNNHWASGCPF